MPKAVQSLELFGKFADLFTISIACSGLKPFKQHFRYPSFNVLEVNASVHSKFQPVNVNGITSLKSLMLLLRMCWITNCAGDRTRARRGGGICLISAFDTIHVNVVLCLYVYFADAFPYYHCQHTQESGLHISARN